MQRERRRDPHPWTWEPPAAAALGALLVLVLGVQVGRGLANLLAGTGWTWPATDTGAGVSSPVGTAFWTSLPNVLTGHADAGLPAPVPAGVAAPGLLCTMIALTELTLLAATTWAITRVRRRWGQGRTRGMATAAEAERLLGVTRLRKVAPVVRPDLYGGHAFTAARAHRRTGSPQEPDVEPGRGLSGWLLNRHPTKGDQ